MRILLLPLLCGLFLTAGAAWPQAVGQYPVALARPCRPGDTFIMQADAQCSTTRAVAQDGRVIDRMDSLTSVSLRGTATIRGVIQNNKVTSLLFAVDSLRYSQDNRQGELFYDKEVLAVTAGTDRPFIKLNGREVGDFEHSLLDLLFPTVISRSQTRSEDALFGTPTPVAPGGVWPVSGEPILAPLLEDEANLKDAVFTGQGRLAALEPVNGVDCLRLQVNIQASNYRYPSQESLPNDLARAFVANTYWAPVRQDMPLMAMTLTHGLMSHYSGRAVVGGKPRQRAITQVIGLSRHFEFHPARSAAPPVEAPNIQPPAAGRP